MYLSNEMALSFPAKSANEGFARVSVAAFAAQLDPTVEELAEIKTVVSEAVTNAIVHGYKETTGIVHIKAKLYSDSFAGKIVITVKDSGEGIKDIKQALEPCFTTGADDRAGMGFTIMQSFTDKFRVTSSLGKGTTVLMEKTIVRRS